MTVRDDLVEAARAHIAAFKDEVEEHGFPFNFALRESFAALERAAATPDGPRDYQQLFTNLLNLCADLRGGIQSGQTTDEGGAEVFVRESAWVEWERGVCEIVSSLLDSPAAPVGTLPAPVEVTDLPAARGQFIAMYAPPEQDGSQYPGRDRRVFIDDVDTLISAAREVAVERTADGPKEQS